MRINVLFGLFYFVFLSFANAQNVSGFIEKSDTFFKNYVTDGKVAYADIKAHTASLDELLEMAKGITVSKENKNEYQAFWINGYNLLVIKSIVENDPIKSPIDQAGFFDKIKHDIGGSSVSLNGIENKLLRKNFSSEPRFHFVLVCGGLGCPPIINEAYKPEILNDQLERQTKLALNDPKFIRVDGKKVKISQIFEWYKSDFQQKGKVVDFINSYRTEKLPEKVKVSYYKYDWTLNDVK